MYFNNILIYLKNKKQHIGHIRKVLEALKKANLQVKPKKLFFYVTKVNYLRFIIFKDGI